MCLRNGTNTKVGIEGDTLFEGTRSLVTAEQCFAALCICCLASSLDSANGHPCCEDPCMTLQTRTQLLTYSFDSCSAGQRQNSAGFDGGSQSDPHSRSLRASDSCCGLAASRPDCTNLGQIHVRGASDDCQVRSPRGAYTCPYGVYASFVHGSPAYFLKRSGATSAELCSFTIPTRPCSATPRV